MNYPHALQVEGKMLRRISLSYDNQNSRESALGLILTLKPEWEHSPGEIEFIRFTDGITNTLLKAVKNTPGASQAETDNECILLRAYGNKTDVLINRDREAESHQLLAKYGLAPPLLARFQNGLLYKFIQGWVTTSVDFQRQGIWRAIARRLAEWHAVLPVVSAKQERPSNMQSPLTNDPSQNGTLKAADHVSSVENLSETIWSVMQKWLSALQIISADEQTRNGNLQTELDRIIAEFGGETESHEPKMVLGHCDLLSGNVIVHPRPGGRATNGSGDHMEVVSFVDYEYATPCPAAFDIANHFAEWGGFDCNYSVLPTRSQRRDFLSEYLKSYKHHQGGNQSSSVVLEQLCQQVDRFRGLPGFYWGIWALIQAKISQIDFDYAAYAETRLGEYWAWKAEASGERERLGQGLPPRERRWAEE